MIRGMTGDIQYIFLHRRNGPGVYPVRFNAGTVNFSGVSGEMPEVAFRYLAPAAIAGTYHQYFYHFIRVILIMFVVLYLCAPSGFSPYTVTLKIPVFPDLNAAISSLLMYCPRISSGMLIAFSF